MIMEQLIIQVIIFFCRGEGGREKDGEKDRKLIKLIEFVAACIDKSIYLK